MTRQISILLVFAAVSLSPSFAAEKLSELTVRLDLQKGDYIEGERIKAVVDVANASVDPIDARGPTAPDRLILELFRASDRHQFEKTSDKPYVEPFALLSGEGQLLDVYFAEHFPIVESTRYYARAVLIHKRTRYESALKSFNVVPGLRCGGAVQMFSNKEGLRREFELVWSLPDVFEFNLHELMMDPDVAGAARVKELYKESGGVEPVKKAWWKFW